MINQVDTTLKLHNYIKLQQTEEPLFILESFSTVTYFNQN